MRLNSLSIDVVPGCTAALTPLASTAAASPDLVLFESLGSVLVVGDDASVGDVAEVVARQQRTVVFAPGIEALALGSHISAVGRKVTALRGYLGAFRAEVSSASGVSDIGAASPNPNRLFDLVLDLGRQPLFTSAVLPLGYFAPGAEEKARATAIESMRALVGRFTKPRYFAYQADLCTHGSSGLQGCSRCLDVCSAQAITPEANTIRVDPHLCQGCASCTLVCPTGALSFKFPSRSDLAQRLVQLLSGDGASQATLLVHSSTLKDPAVIGQLGALALALDPLSAFGDELWLRSFALGVGTLVLVDDPQLSPKSRQTIASSVAQMHALLPTLGIARERLVWLAESALAGWFETQSSQRTEAATPPGAPSALAIGKPASSHSASSSWARYKRLAWIDGLRLLGAADNTRAAVALPTGASFGEVRVNRQRCTLCFSCANLCPTHALKVGKAPTEQLIFQESACVQCGLCVQACPEKAISLRARFAPQALAQMTSTVLQEGEMLACKSCGTPFISRRLLAASLERLKGHPMLAKGGADAMMTCRTCRQRGL
jgi:ferredoxin